ncbi:MAG: hypothetical protein GC137_00455 [Alphaproteobacteria bacterium]|nr:hypothetical protein [Alphaproteobacteria bacterium]
MNSSATTSLHFSPLLDPLWLWVIAIIGALLFVLSFANYRRVLIWRTIAFVVFMLALVNPSLLKQDRKPVRDVAVIVVDKSYSQSFGKRQLRAEEALAYLTNTLEEMNLFDVRIIDAPPSNILQNRTDLFETLDQSISDIPKKRRAGVIFITDGQVHDVPQNEAMFQTYGPIHALLTGEKSEKDRQIVITHAPAYGLVGKNITVKFRVQDTENIKQQNTLVTLRLHSGVERVISVQVGKEQTIILPIEHASQNIFSLSVEGIKDEITLANNKAPIIINGVRDRLKVLLVSGIPHAGERTWRNLLTSDPGVDLVHFTILREPQKLDYTPKNELSLIAFPFKELFEIKLYDFDLIIFDRYQVNNVLPRHYFENIARYVREGGAFLEASGPVYATQSSIYQTPLGDILPAEPTGRIFEEAYKPVLSNLGTRHPVTESLVWNNQQASPGETPPWGTWLRAVEVENTSGDVLMNGARDKPLLILDRVGKGRVAQLTSDHIWLWSRGYDGGGPHAALLRRIVHWLMKEPELDDRALDIIQNKNNITVRKQNFANTPEEGVAMTKPNGEQEIITLKATDNGFLEYKFTAEDLGIYSFQDINGTRKFAIIGDVNPLELQGVITTDEKLKPLIDASDGTSIWLDETPTPPIRAYQDARRYGGSNWLALKRNNDFSVQSVRKTPLLLPWVTLLLALSALVFLWWREGQTR